MSKVVPGSHRMLLAVLALTVAAPNAAAAAGFRPGAWEITRTMEGGPGKVAPQVARTCFTLDQLKADPLAPVKVQPTPQEGERAPKCVIGQTDIVGGKVVMEGNCKGPLGARKIIWSGSHAPEQFELGGTLKFGFMSGRMRISGRHVGSCTPKD